MSEFLTSIAKFDTDKSISLSSAALRIATLSNNNDDRNEQRKSGRTEEERLDGREHGNVCGRIAEQQHDKRECRSGSIRKRE